jgi:hypothetical protein
LATADDEEGRDDEEEGRGDDAAVREDEATASEVAAAVDDEVTGPVPASDNSTCSVGVMHAHASSQVAPRAVRVMREA